MFAPLVFAPALLLPLMFLPLVPAPSTTVVIVVCPRWCAGHNHPENPKGRYNRCSRPHDDLLTDPAAAATIVN
jgi:hypothetical protein